MNEIQFQIIEGIPGQTLLSDITRLNRELFNLGETSQHLFSFFQRQEQLLFCLAYQQDELVGYKIGFQAAPRVFESWRGGVSPKFRKQGIAQKLLGLQHLWCEENNLHTIQTVTDSTNNPMLMLNLSNGFMIIGMTVNRRNHLKIQLEKRIFSENTHQDS